MAHCDLCQVDVMLSLDHCPLCGKHLYDEETLLARAQSPVPHSYPDFTFSYRKARFKQTLQRSFRPVALIPAFLCYLINVLTWQGVAWWIYVLVGLLGGWMLARIPQRLPRPRTTYLIFIIELMILFYLGLIAFALRSTDWYFAYAIPGIVLGAGVCILVITSLMHRALRKCYSPLLLQCAIGIVPFFVALGTGENTWLSKICALASIVFLLWFLYTARRWLPNELHRKMHR